MSPKMKSKLLMGRNKPLPRKGTKTQRRGRRLARSEGRNKPLPRKGTETLIKAEGRRMKDEGRKGFVG